MIAAYQQEIFIFFNSNYFYAGRSRFMKMMIIHTVDAENGNQVHLTLFESMLSSLRRLFCC